MLRKVLLICGIVSSLLCVVTDIFAGMQYEGYDFTSQAVSELFAIGAPTSRLVVPLFTLFDVLLVAFAWGIWLSADRNRVLRVMSLMVIGNAIIGLMLWNFFPMHMRGAESTFTDTMHVILASNPFVPLSVGLGVFAFRNWFRYYSIFTILLLIVPATFVFLNAQQVATNQPTPWLGLTERISIYSVLLWYSVLAIVLLRKQPMLKYTNQNLK